jgi:hypothetical protein
LVAGTFDVHRVLHLARAHEVANEMFWTLQRGYLGGELNPFDPGDTSSSNLKGVRQPPRSSQLHESWGNRRLGHPNFQAVVTIMAGSSGRSPTKFEEP